MINLLLEVELQFGISGSIPKNEEGCLLQMKTMNEFKQSMNEIL